MSITQRISFSMIVLIVGIGLCIFYHKIVVSMTPDIPFDITSYEQLTHLFPKKPETLKIWADRAKKRAEKDVTEILAIEPEKRTFENTMLALDRSSALYFNTVRCVAEVVSLVYKEADMREIAREVSIELSQFALDLYGQNKKLFETISSYAQTNAKKEQLTSAEQYAIKESLEGYRRLGLHLSQEIQNKVNGLLKEISALVVQFQKNIDEDKSDIVATKDQLKGLDEDFIAGLKHDEQGNYILPAQSLIYFPIIEYGALEETRKRAFESYIHRAASKNIEILKKILTLREQVANLLGYKSYAAFDISSQMAKTPQHVQEFLNNLVPSLQEKWKKEFVELTKDLPEDIHLTNGEIDPWNLQYVKSQYKKNYFDFEDRDIAEYFPIEHTFKEMMDIYQTFFSLEFQEKKLIDLWDDEVKCVEVRRKGEQQVLGYLLLDLFPRPNKYSHACEDTIIYGYKDQQGIQHTTVALVIANLPKPSDSKPALLELSQARTFFHEFGHAMHAVLGGSNLLVSQSGTHTKTDFVELPSQILEQWLWDKDILKKISAHYKTGEPLSDELIGKIQASKNLTSGLAHLQQALYANLALDYHAAGEQKDPIKIFKSLKKSMVPFINIYEEDYFPAAFTHLGGYGACYYSYLWSQVFAFDIFDQIKNAGLLNSTIGKKYQEAILAPGGSQDPNDLLEKFLGRAPTEQAFFKHLGL